MRPRALLVIWLLFAPAAAAAQHPYKLQRLSPREVVGFSGHAVPSLVRVAIVDSLERQLTADECAKLWVEFRPYLDGQAGPDVQMTVWDEEQGCVADARWRLADASGVQRLRAAVMMGSDLQPASNPLVMEAVARAAPRLSFGLAMVYRDRGLLTLEDVADTTLAATNNDRDFRVQPMFGVDFPIIFFSRRAFLLDRLRMFLGFSFENPTREFFATLKVLPWTHEYEDLPIHLNAGLRVQRLSVVVTGDDCAALSAAGDGCARNELEWNLLVSVTVETQTLLDPILQAIGISP